MNIDQFIDPMTEKVKDLIDGINLVKDIIASYSLTPEDVPNEEITLWSLFVLAKPLRPYKLLENGNYSRTIVPRRLSDSFGP
jgi:hypothetical protein